MKKLLLLALFASTPLAAQQLTGGATGVTTASGLDNGVTGTGHVVLDNTPTLITPILGTPTSGTMTNVSGTAANLTAGHVTTNANLTGPITSVGNATSVASTFNMGAADSAAPAAQSITVPSVVAGTSNTAGAAFTINGSQGTGTGAGGSLLFKTAPAGGSGTSQNALVTALTINSAGNIFSGSTANTGFFMGGATSDGFSWPFAGRIYTYVGGTDQFMYSSGEQRMGSGINLGWSSSTPSAAGADTYLTRKTTATLRQGTADAAAPVAQTLTVQGVVAGTSNTAGALWTFDDSTGTGSAASGGFSFRVHPLGGSGTSQNAASAALTISGAGLAALPLIGSDATHTDATVCEDTTTHALYAGSGTAGICLGTSSARFKTAIRPLTYGVREIMLLRPVSFHYKPGYGTPSKKMLGFTAEDMRPVLPELVGLDTHGRPSSADYVGIVPILVKAMQEQQAEIEELKAQIRSLAAR